ncbi:MAG: TldD/PmbA family protein [Ruminococcaceae bacterium]|nr:TldD/PmbA family protein [Oscillospiraceae bacterium]
MRFPEKLYADIRIEEVFKTEIAYENGKLRQNKENHTKGAFLRVFDGKRWYYCATTELDRLQEELDSLASMAMPNEDISEHPVVKRFQVHQDKVMTFESCAVHKIANEEKVALLESYLPLLTEVEQIAVSKAGYTDVYSCRHFISSLGADITYDYQHAGMMLAYTMNVGDSPYSNSQRLFEQNFENLKNRQEELRALIAEELDYAKNAVPVEPGVYTCVFSPETTGVFAHESFGHKSESDFMLGSETMRKEWAIGTKVGWEGLNIIDSGIPSGSGFVPYDDEGNKATETYLIKNGILTGRLHSALTAAALEEAVTGNARATTFEFEPIVRMTSTFIGSGEDTFESLLQGAEGGIYIPDYFHGSGMSTFTIAPSRAYRIRDGKIAEPVRVSVVSGNVMETLFKIDGATKETKLCSSAYGGCGKMEQFPLRVAFGGPYLRVRELTVQ